MKRFSNILCVVDPDKTMDTVVEQSVKIASDHQADITFISVIKETKFWRKVFSDKEDYANDLDKYIESKRLAIEQCIRSTGSSVKAAIVVSSGIRFIEIIKRVNHHRHDLVVKCAEDMDWVDRMLGGEDMHLLRKCPCPVLMLRPEQKDHFRKVLATVDVNDDHIGLEEERVQEQLNQQVLEYGAALSMPELSEMHIGSAWEAYGEDFYRFGAFSQLPEDKVDQYVEQERRECTAKLETLVRRMENILGKAAVQYLQPRSHLVNGKASKEIPMLVENLDIDLIVMGTVGRVGIPGLIIGNTAESILEQTKCSILAIKPEGFKTPVED
ncbi:MAG: universal stress protein [Pseudomonadales bacterium]|nr:universal stress protein [Pseudomonadales bacterium]